MLCSIVKQKSRALAILNFSLNLIFQVNLSNFEFKAVKLTVLETCICFVKDIIIQNRKDLSSHVPGTLLGTLASLFWSNFLANCWSYRLTYPTCLSCPIGSHFVSMLTCLVVIVLPQPETFVVLPIFLPWFLLLFLSLFSFLGFVCFWDRVSL